MQRALRPPFFILLAILAALTVSVSGENAPARLEPWSKGTLDVHQISTGRGNAALVVFPDGTTLLFDAGDAGGIVPLATPLPDGSRPAGEWVARYVKRAVGEGARLDYAVISHFHIDHVGGFGKVVDELPIGKLIDRGYPDYGEPAAPSAKDTIFAAYRSAAEAAAAKGTVRERARPGRADQILSVRGGGLSQVDPRNVAANGGM